MRGMGQAGGKGQRDGKGPSFGARARTGVTEEKGPGRGRLEPRQGPVGEEIRSSEGRGALWSPRGEDGGGEPGPGRYLSWVFIILGGSAQGGRRRRREWVGGRVGGCGVARAGRSLRAKSLSGRGPRTLLLPQRAPASN
jgi:hypothetical protein